MLEALPTARVEPVLGATLPGDPEPLRKLTTRSSDDATIALIDAWACTCDVLGFYGERILNEGYLTTALERRSVLELARAVGYEPSAGVAASTLLAFGVDPNAPEGKVSIPVGLPVGSIPAQNEQPQTFETVESIEARSEWNELHAAATRRQHLVTDAHTIWLSGVATRLVKGDAIVLVGQEVDPAPGTSPSGSDERWDFRFVVSAEIDTARGVTRVELDRGLGDHHTLPADQQPVALVFRRRAALFGFNAANPTFMSFPAGVNRSSWVDTTTVDGQVHEEWKHFALGDDPAVKRHEIDLDREYEGILNGSFVVLQSGLLVEFYKVKHASPRKRRDFGLALKCTRLTLDTSSRLGGENLESFERRSTTIYIDSERLPLDEAPWTEPVSGRTIELDGVVGALSPGQRVLVTGQTLGGAPLVHATVVRSCSDAAPDVLRVATRSVLELDAPLPEALVRDSVRICANVAFSTHGSSIEEALGHGDASSANVEMRLRQSPLTWVSADNASGRQATLDLYIDGVTWSETESLFDAGPIDRVYQLRTDADGGTTVTFGDGIHGARLPNGIENVRVAYRKGIGIAGEVQAAALSVLQRRPAGLRTVTNPTAAEGGADPESAEEIRSNAALRVLTLDRLVSVQDYEDFARAFAGIGKAQAVELWDGKRSVLHLTVASASGHALSAGSEVMRRLSAALARYADPVHVALVSSFDEVRFGIGLAILREAGRDKDALALALRTALEQAFSFGARSFGQSVTDAEITAIVQAVPGVVASDLVMLYRNGTARTPSPRLTAARARWSGGVALRAELLLVDPAAIEIRWIDS
jgi:predicted phage baseplate assembly protein